MLNTYLIISMSSVSVETCGYIKKDMTWVSWGEVWRKEGKMQRQCDRNKATSWNLAHLHWPFYSQRSRSRGKIQPLASPLEFLWWLRSPFHLHEFPHAPHSFSIMLRVSKCLTNGSYFYCMIPYIYGNKKKKMEKRKLKVSAIYLQYCILPPYLSPCPTPAQTTSPCQESGDSGDEKTEQSCKGAWRRWVLPESS